MQWDMRLCSLSPQCFIMRAIQGLALALIKKQWENISYIFIKNRSIDELVFF